MEDPMSKMDKVTPDGGILKILLRDGDKTKPRPQWVRGANARFHYQVYTYGKPMKESSPQGSGHDHSAKSGHTHGNGPCCSHTRTATKDVEVSANREFPQPKRKKVGDSREDDPERPFELRIGFSFSVKAMEMCVKTMTVGERSRFLCMPEYCEGYVQLAKVLKQERENRNKAKQGLPTSRVHGCCAHALHQEMESQSDLAELYNVPLEFEIELVDVQSPDSYVREPWEMETIDKYREAPIRKEEGGKLYKEGRYPQALEKYTRALALLESVSMSSTVMDMQRAQVADGKKSRQSADLESDSQTEDTKSEVDNEINLDTLNALMQACRLNYAACKLKLGDPESVIPQCTEVLKQDPTNVKALFRRGQAFLQIGRDLDLAQHDFEKLRNILEAGNYAKAGPEFTELRKEEQLLETKLRAHREKERRMFSNIFK
ncbi:uncharacterized protein SPPG_02000 [Spizellomyces punctatus DAOM BR117]|uniref:Uncharacterized protein n=1 Tax=Spizellomyces punctatus (strain DAOM BR117) TaxID=645134 RepID=A0A0L0HQ33_SPIPD|nr:uncharacterized protein SPPG_02000 [Spizellomyces punctatus DAOM BR117]KND02919.1 hypothetical protein SPPG_02000 [Spizellomyces punctatus DAOM BR117]|eukprot:XP_016610958.1 hypothetical protein SPPG_02000 [Spizellomyces punctatus DAOM BR117]